MKYMSAFTTAKDRYDLWDEKKSSSQKKLTGISITEDWQYSEHYYSIFDNRVIILKHDELTGF